MTEGTPNGPNSESRSNGTGRGAWENVKEFLNEVGRGIGKLVESGNRRQLIIRNKEQQTLLRLPLTLAVVLVLALALLRLLPLVVIGVIVALVLKVQFVVATDVSESE